MCIIIVNKQSTLSKETLHECWNRNPEGSGLLWTENNKLMTYKTLTAFSNFYDKYKEIRKQEGVIILHSRIATEGKVDRINCHPFLVNENLGFCHNGIIDTGYETKDCSDTYTFNEVVLKELQVDFLQNPAIMMMLAEYIGKSKLALLNNEGKFWIINEKLGHWDEEGNWYSNDSYKPIKQIQKSVETGKQLVLIDETTTQEDLNAKLKLLREEEEKAEKEMSEFLSKYKFSKCVMDCGREASIIHIQEGCLLCEECYRVLQAETAFNNQCAEIEESPFKQLVDFD